MSTTSPDTLKSAGPFLLGYLLNYGLYGALTVQVYLYYIAFQNDRTAVKAIVYGVYLVETAQVFMITYDAFQNFVYGFGQPGALNKINLLSFDCCIIDGAVACVVQTFFAYRIFLLSKSKLLTGIIVLISLVQLGGAITTAAQAETDSVFSQVRENFIPVSLWLGGSAACDIVIAVSMTYVLSRYDPSIRETRDLVRRIIRLTMETGSLTATVATVDLILFLSSKFPYHVTPALALAKLYSNSMMVIFNSRIKIVGGRGQSSMSIGEGGISIISQGHSGLESLSRAQPRRLQTYHSDLSVGVKREIVIDVQADSPRTVQRSNVELRTHSIQVGELNSNEELQEQTKKDADSVDALHRLGS
ncbi:hypothetical protein E1B28_005156 [Marasmius oreades]|uniref:DUF6534 domain-containing protein n=1 Tax=Marasmius oreades TaxID=181124 RepID=A0A9P8ADJ0_9AGAR|nr:uncharacterized protein E1B28_005156 [Marasmius oreades]KAG7097841.1 hypothetical protein E1B28_005156 [Marasmius oreades]